MNDDLPTQSVGERKKRIVALIKNLRDRQRGDISGIVELQGIGALRVNDDIRFFDRYLVPVTRALDPLFGGFFGQSVVVIARRP